MATAPDPYLDDGPNGALARPLWERLDDETPKAWEAFTEYRGLGIRRTLKGAARIHYGHTDDDQVTEPQLHQCKRWSVKYRWRDRAAAFDEYVDELALVELVDEQKEMRKRVLLEGRVLQTKGIQRIRALMAGEMTPAVALRAIEVGVKLESMALGVASETVAHHHTVEDRREQAVAAVRDARARLSVVNGGKA